jgi:hypothetical protein
MTTSVTLVHPRQSVQVAYRLLIDKCGLFTDDPTLSVFPYARKSQVSLADFLEFVSAQGDNSVNHHH